jgi:hypothetical protein
MKLKAWMLALAFAAIALPLAKTAQPAVKAGVGLFDGWKPIPTWSDGGFPVPPWLAQA